MTPDTLDDAVGHGLLQLDRRWIAASRLSALGTAAYVGLLLAAGVAFLVFAAELPFQPLVITAAVIEAVIVLRALIWPGIQYRYAAYRLGEQALTIRRGVLWRSVIDVPRSRIQHSDVSQSPFERMYGLGTLTVYTAGNQHSAVPLRGLDYQRALEIRGHLMSSNDDDVV